MNARLSCCSAIGLLLATNLILAESVSNEIPPLSPTATIGGQSGKEFATVQSALEAAPSGAVIYLSAGRFNERIVIRKPVTVVGAGAGETILGPTKTEQEDHWDEATSISRMIDDKMRTVAEANPPREITEKEADNIKRDYKKMSRLVETCLEPVVLIEGIEKVVLRALGVTMPLTPTEGSGLQVTAAVKVDSAEVQLIECAIVGCMSNGIGVTGNSILEIKNCLVAACWGTGVTSSHPNDSVVHIADSDIRNNYHYNISLGVEKCDIEGCRISGTAWSGISTGAKRVLIERNAIFHNSRGIYSVGENGVVRNNLIYRNNVGASCWSPEEPLYEANLFLENKQSALFVSGPAVPEIRQNMIVDSLIGVKYGPMKITGGEKPHASEYAIEGNLFWKIGTPTVVSPSRETSSLDKPIEVLDTEGNRRVDPQLSIADHQQLKIGNVDLLREKNFQVLTKITLQSRWPATPEELAMIPDDGTVQSSKWKKRQKN